MRTSFLTIFLLFAFVTETAFAANRDSERLQALKEQIAKEELRSKELTARAIRLQNEIGAPSDKIPSPQTLKSLDDSLSLLQNAPKNFLTAEELRTFRFYVDYNLTNVAKAYTSVYSRWEAYHYIVHSHMQDHK